MGEGCALKWDQNRIVSVAEIGVRWFFFSKRNERGQDSDKKRGRITFLWLPCSWLFL